MAQAQTELTNEGSTVLSALVQAFSALGIFVFYFGWVWEDSYFQMFGLRASALDFPFYYFLIQGLKVNFPFQIDGQLFTRWQVFALLINLLLVLSALMANTSKQFKNYVATAPKRTLLLTTAGLVVLFLAMHYVGSKAGHDRAEAILNSPGLLRSVSYEYTAESNAPARRFAGYLLLLTKDRLFVLQALNLQSKAISDQSNALLSVTIIPLSELAYVRTSGYSLQKRNER
jgi:hypothetical protein